MDVVAPKKAFKNRYFRSLQGLENTATTTDQQSRKRSAASMMMQADLSPSLPVPAENLAHPNHEHSTASTPTLPQESLKMPPAPAPSESPSEQLPLYPLAVQPEIKPLRIDPHTGRILLDIQYTSLGPNWEGSAFSNLHATTPKSPDVQQKELTNFMANNWNLVDVDPFLKALFDFTAQAKVWQESER